MPFTKFNSRNLLQVPEKRTFSLASLVSNQGFDQNINLQYSREYRNLNKFAYIFKRPTKFRSRKWEVGIGRSVKESYDQPCISSSC